MGLVMVVLRLELLGEKGLLLRLVPAGEGEFLGAGAGVDPLQKIAVFGTNRAKSAAEPASG